MLKLSSKQRELLADKIADLGNIAFGSLVFGWVVRAESFNYVSLLLGLLIGGAAYWYATDLEK